MYATMGVLSSPVDALRVCVSSRAFSGMSMPSGVGVDPSGDVFISGEAQKDRNRMNENEMSKTIVASFAFLRLRVSASLR